MEVNGFERAKGAAGFGATGGGCWVCPGGRRGAKTPPKTGVFFFFGVVIETSPKKWLEFRFFFGGMNSQIWRHSPHMLCWMLCWDLLHPKQQGFKPQLNKELPILTLGRFLKHVLDNKNDTWHFVILSFCSCGVFWNSWELRVFESQVVPSRELRPPASASSARVQRISTSLGQQLAMRGSRRSLGDALLWLTTHWCEMRNLRWDIAKPSKRYVLSVEIQSFGVHLYMKKDIRTFSRENWCSFFW